MRGPSPGVFFNAQEIETTPTGAPVAVTRVMDYWQAQNRRTPGGSALASPARDRGRSACTGSWFVAPKGDSRESAIKQPAAFAFIPVSEYVLGFVNAKVRFFYRANLAVWGAMSACFRDRRVYEEDWVLEKMLVEGRRPGAVGKQKRRAELLTDPGLSAKAGSVKDELIHSSSRRRFVGGFAGWQWPGAPATRTGGPLAVGKLSGGARGPRLD